jgi:alkanesulfonate monooxygenase SsuD/methylene tetrahydromethanopterin reductase-like flavin-dependent oxidoreductase (luciferase family)
MLDQMSGGRLELGVGRGVSPHEVAYYGVDPGRAQAMYVESLRIILAALAGRSLSYAGEFYTFSAVPFELQPVQRRRRRDHRRGTGDRKAGAQALAPELHGAVE